MNNRDMTNRSSKPKDTQQLARAVLDAIAPDAESVEEAAESVAKGKNPAAVALGRRGGKVGGKARAAKARWAKKDPETGGSSQP